MAPPTDEENSPLLSPTLYDGDDGNEGDDDDGDDEDPQTVQREPLKQRTVRFLASKPGHHCVLVLASLDVASIFIALILRLLACEQCIPPRPGVRTECALDIVGLALTCLFVVELGARVWVTGWAYFRPWFDCLDAMVIVLDFAVGILLEGALRQVASLVVVFRLLRVFRIIEEVGTSAEEQMGSLREQIAFLVRKNESLRRELMHLRAK